MTIASALTGTCVRMTRPGRPTPSSPRRRSSGGGCNSRTQAEGPTGPLARGTARAARERPYSTPAAPALQLAHDLAGALAALV